MTYLTRITKLSGAYRPVILKILDSEKKYLGSFGSIPYFLTGLVQPAKFFIASTRVKGTRAD